MTDSVQEQLLGYLLGALDESEQETVAARLESDAEVRERLAEVRDRLERLSSAWPSFSPPPGLAERTCCFVASQRRSPVLTASRRRPMSPATAPPSWIGRIRWVDVAVAAGIFLAAGLLLLPAIHGSRFRARITTCQDKVGKIGEGLTQYSEYHGGDFPRVPAEGKLAAAGIYAPTLLSNGLLAEASEVVCPSSALAEQRAFRIPSLEELQSAAAEEVNRLLPQIGGSYGYCFGHMEDGTYRPTRNFRREHFALVSDSPSDQLPDHQSLNHGGRGQNVLYEDGSVRFMVSPRVADHADHFFTNDDGLVAAGRHLHDSVIGSSASRPIIYVDYR